MDPTSDWANWIETMRKRSDLGLGRPDRAHLWNGVERPLRQCFVTRSLCPVEDVSLLIGDCIVLCVARGGELHPYIASRLHLTGDCNLLQHLGRLYRDLVKGGPIPEARVGADTALDLGGKGTMMAAWGLLGIRTGADLWVQSFVNGLPYSPPASVEAAGISALQVICFRTKESTGLPFTPDDVERSLSPQFDRHRARIHLRYEPVAMEDTTPPARLSDSAAATREALNAVFGG